MLRSGFYENGIFRFIVTFPKNFPREMPNIVFKNKIFHPYINPSGKLDLNVNYSFSFNFRKSSPTGSFQFADNCWIFSQNSSPFSTTLNTSNRETPSTQKLGKCLSKIQKNFSNWQWSPLKTVEKALKNSLLTVPTGSKKFWRFPMKWLTFSKTKK